MNLSQLQSLLALLASDINSQSSQPATVASASPNVGKAVLVRTFHSGVHFGTLMSRDGQNVTLSDARRIWCWSGANTLNEIALSGISATGSKVSEPVAEIELLDALEIIPLTTKASKNLAAIGWK